MGVKESLVDYIDRLLLCAGISVTGIPIEQIPTDAQIRFRYPMRHGGMGFSSLRSQMHGAYAAAWLEGLYPSGIDALNHLKDKGLDWGFRSFCPLVARLLPHIEWEDRLGTPRQVMYA